MPIFFPVNDILKLSDIRACLYLGHLMVVDLPFSQYIFDDDFEVL